MQFLAFGDWLLANKIQSRINRDGYYKSPNPDKPEPKKKIKSAPRRVGAETQRIRKGFLCDPFAPLREIFVFWDLNFHFLPKNGRKLLVSY